MLFLNTKIQGDHRETSIAQTFFKCDSKTLVTKTKMSGSFISHLNFEKNISKTSKNYFKHSHGL